MRNLLNPKWLFIINTLPLVLLFSLFFGQFNIIKTLLEEDSIQLWKVFGLSLGTLGLVTFVYAIYLSIKKERVSILFATIALPSYIAFIYLYLFYLDEIIPSSIPQWMVSSSFFLYVGTFLMPTLVYALLILVAHFTEENKEYKAWVNFLIAVAIPISAYLFIQIILPLWQPFEKDFGIHSMLILVIALTLVFLFFLIRGVFILTTKKLEVWKAYQIFWKVPIAIILPLIGLGVNNGSLFNSFGVGGVGIFGDFNNSWFYLLAIVNGILICLPNLEHKLYRLVLFVGRCTCFAYTFYFFLVFLPFLPLSLIAVIAMGTGFLMLTPLLLFLLHVNQLSKDFNFLKKLFSNKLIIGISLLSFFIIPASITITYLNDKKVLNETLTYLYSPDYSLEYDVDKKSVRKTLDVIKSYKSSRGRVFGSETPYLSSYFNYLVMDNLSLSDSKIDRIEKIFFGKTPFNRRSPVRQNDDVQISNIETRSVYDKAQNAWKSWIDLELTNENENNGFAEYKTEIDLPEGCWISDYYLYVGDRKEAGILAEKKAAKWIFSQIRNENRDPGILYYLKSNKVAFKVFPFAKAEIRKTGIQFLHKEPIRLNIDSNIVELGNAEETTYKKTETAHAVYISAKDKESLKSVKREPYFHFLVDVSIRQNANRGAFIKRIEQLVEDEPSLLANAKISFVNSFVHTMTLKDDWKQLYEKQDFEGGFYLDRAIRKILFHAHKDKSESYPVIVVVTDSIQHAVLDRDFSDLSFTFPESDIFFNLDGNGNLKEHSLMNNPMEEITRAKPRCRFCERVLEYKLADNSSVYLADNNQPSILLKKDLFEIEETEIEERDWNSALNMQAKWLSQNLHPESSDKEWLNLVKYSFISRVMSPVTSYLVVENEAQKAMLKKKQKQVLSANKALDLGEETTSMSEPGLIILSILLLLIFRYRTHLERVFISLRKR